MDKVEIIGSLVLIVFLIEEIYTFLKYKYTWNVVSTLNDQYRINEYAGRYHLKDIKSK